MSLLYRFVHTVVSVGFRFYFKKVQYSGLENIPTDKPILLASNHPTAFFEPVILAVTLPIELNFITRGDVFEKPFYRKILEMLNMIPIFRFRDGFANMKSNLATMDYVYKALGEKKKILLFVEGSTKTAWRLRPMQKGLSRMAFGNYERFGDLDLQVLPVGFTYENPHKRHTEVSIEVGKPIALRDYYALHAENPNHAINKLTRDIGEQLQPLIVHLTKPENDDLAGKLFQMYRLSFPLDVFPIFQPSKRRLRAQQEIAENLNQASDEKIADLRQKMTDYEADLQCFGLKDVAIAQPYHARLGNNVALVLGAIPYALGVATHYLPVWYAERIRKNRIKYYEFEGPIVFAVATFLTLFFYIFMLFVALWFRHFAIWVACLLLPLLGFYALIYRDRWNKVRAARRLQKLENESEIATKLFEKRHLILESVRGKQ